MRNIAALLVCLTCFAAVAIAQKPPAKTSVQFIYIEPDLGGSVALIDSKIVCGLSDDVLHDPDKTPYCTVETSVGTHDLKVLFGNNHTLEAKVTLPMKAGTKETLCNIGKTELKCIAGQ